MSQESMGIVADLVLDHSKYTQFLEQNEIPKKLEGVSKKGLEIFKEIIVGTRSYRYQDIFNPQMEFEQWDLVVRKFSQSTIVNSLNDGDLSQFLDFLLNEDKFEIEEKNHFIMELMNYSLELVENTMRLESVSSLGGYEFKQKVVKHHSGEEFFILFFDGEEMQELQIDEESFLGFSETAQMTEDLHEFFTEWGIL